eukprot:IDg14835t1
MPFSYGTDDATCARIGWKRLWVFEQSDKPIPMRVVCGNKLPPRCVGLVNDVRGAKDCNSVVTCIRIGNEKGAACDSRTVTSALHTASKAFAQNSRSVRKVISSYLSVAASVGATLDRTRVCLLGQSARAQKEAPL